MNQFHGLAQGSLMMELLIILSGSGTWHHLALVGTGTNVNFYLDGTRIAQVSQQGTPYPLQTTPILVGNLNDLNETYKGLIDELRISNIARYTGSTYTVPASKFTPDANTVGLWHFDEGTGNVSYEASSSNKNAVLYNGVIWPSRGP